MTCGGLYIGEKMGVDVGFYFLALGWSLEQLLHLINEWRFVSGQARRGKKLDDTFICKNRTVGLKLNGRL